MGDKLDLHFDKISVQEQKYLTDFLFKNNDIIIEVGDYLISSGSNSGAYKVTNIVKCQYRKWKDSTTNGEKDFELIDDVKIECGGSATMYSHSFSGYTVWKGTLEELEESAMDFINKPFEIPKTENQQQGLMSFDKKAFSTLKEGLVLKAQSMQSKFSMAEKMLQKKRWELQAIMKPLLEEVKRITQIIWTIELYLGIKENIMLVQKGKEASLEEPIHLMQERLYMDEEVGDPTDGGIDITSMDKFYDWMADKSTYFKCFNYELLLPYKKSVRIMRIRREKKEYGDAWTNVRMIDANFETVVLIRNGETIYSIETDMVFGNQLFPAEDELMNLSNQIKNNSGEWYERKTEDDFKNTVDRYKRNFIIMQGLIDRTEVFGQLFGRVNLMNGTAIEKGQIIFKYDADVSNIIGDGDISFIDKLQSVVREIGAGSRVLHYHSWSEKDNEFEFFKLPFAYNRRFYPKRPKSGELRELLYDKEHNCLYFKYLPSEEYYDRATGEYKQRKNKVSFRIEPDTKSTIDVDAFSHRDADWLNKMMHDRRQRKHYNKYMFILKEIIKFKKKELEEESPFCLLVQSQNSCTEIEALDAIFWWKTKNKYKRSLKEDDSKALRMIKKHLKK